MYKNLNTTLSLKGILMTSDLELLHMTYLLKQEDWTACPHNQESVRLVP